MYHSYEAQNARVMVAKAPNLCRGCLKRIPKGKKYLLVFLRDTCKHYVGGHIIGFHKKIKLCRACRGAAYSPRPGDGRVLFDFRYKERVHGAMMDMGISRYELAIKKEKA